MHEMKNGTLCMAILAAVAVFASPPEAPKPDEWTFRQELSKPVAYHALEAYRLADEFCLTGNLETVRTDLERFLASAGRPAEKTLTLRRGKVAGRESYRCEVCAGGNVVLTAEDADGIRRAVYWFEDRVAAGDLAPCVRRPWLRNRISRCFFGPIKRPPFNRDELMDDVDYYPDEYLNRLAHEGVNGLWLTVEWRNLVETSFNRRDPNAQRRLDKLRRTVDKCRRYGIATWVFCIEPRSMDADDPLIKACPRLTGGVKGGWEGKYLLCPSTPEGRQYLEEAVRDLFSQVPGLPGILNISHGERSTTCLSLIHPVHPTDFKCPNCKGLRPWEIHCRMAEAVVRGMRTVSPEAEFLSWFYQPYVEMDRLPWTADVARHLPEGVTMIYNFESGAVKSQLGRYRPGGDYWLSYVGPSPSFEKVAEASREVNGRLGAKIQVGNSHECATVPFVPVPGLLYRKYRAMKAARCSTVMQCWYFGNYPGVMNKAAGELAFDDFSETEDAFLERLARPEWGADAGTVAKLWKDLSDAYAEYPISNDMQYYGPFHSGIVWTLEPYVNMAPLARTWKPLDPPGGDVIGECLENHTIEEACLLSGRMASVAGNKTLDVFAAKYAGDRDRRLDIGVMKALGILFASGADALEFYRLRAKAVASRERNDAASAQRALAGMRAILLREKDLTAQMLPLASEDSRLGFHSEAELHHFHPARLAWRMGELDRALAEVDAISRTLGKGGTYPLSEHEKKAPAMRRGEWTVAKDGKARFRADFAPNGDFVLEGEDLSCGRLRLNTIDACGVSWARHVNVRRDGTWSTDADNVITPQHEVKEYTAGPSASGWSFRLVLDCRGWGDNPARRPAWLCLVGDSVPLWPGIAPSSEYRLNIGNMSPDVYGRIW